MSQVCDIVAILRSHTIGKYLAPTVPNKQGEHGEDIFLVP